MEVVLLGLIGGAVLGYFGRWAQVRFIDERSMTRVRKMAERRDTLREIANRLDPVLNQLHAMMQSGVRPDQPGVSVSSVWHALSIAVDHLVSDWLLRWSHVLSADAWVGEGLEGLHGAVIDLHTETGGRGQEFVSGLLPIRDAAEEIQQRAREEAAA